MHTYTRTCLSERAGKATRRRGRSEDVADEVSKWPCASPWSSSCSCPFPCPLPLPLTMRDPITPSSRRVAALDCPTLTRAWNNVNTYTCVPWWVVLCMEFVSEAVV